jgi:hypothetical protein
MKMTIGSITAAGAVLLSSAIQSFGIEGIRIAVQCPDVILGWPSMPGETYIVQWRPTLDPSTNWVTLTNSLPADWSTNWTIFVHSNQVQCPSGPTSAMSLLGANSLAPQVFSAALVDAVLAGQPSYPLSMPPMPPVRTNGTWMAWEDVFGPQPPIMMPIPDSLRQRVLTAAAQGTLVVPSPQSDSGTLNGPMDGPQPQDGDPPPDPGFYQVVRVGVSLFGLTNGTFLSGIVHLPVEAGYDQGALSSLTLTANSQPVEGTKMLAQPFSRPLTFTVDTRRLLNGDYYLQAVGEWAYAPVDEYDQGYVQFYSPGTLVTVSNVITYQDWVQDFRDGLMLINETSTITNVDWKVDLYGQDGRYVISFTNHSDDGQINLTWNLTNSVGIGQTDTTFTAVTTLTVPDPVAFIDTNPPLVKVVDNYPDQGLWITARAVYIPLNTENYDLYTNVQNYFAQMGEAGGGVLPGQPYRNPGQTLVLSRATGITNWAKMYQAFTNHAVRNFYFDGHGGPDWIGYGWDTNGQPTRTLTASVVAQALGNDTATTNATRYRWVWIDSCSSAVGAWPQTFGLGNRENVPLPNYVSRPGAFCGFNRDVYGWTPFHNRVDPSSIDYRDWFLYYWWFDGDSLITAFDEAEFLSNFPDAQYLKVYGYWGMGWSQYNTKAEWP